MSKNVAMFVDVANLYYAARGQDVDVDYIALLKHATKGRDLIRAYAYSGLDPENENQKKFIDFLSKNGYKVLTKDIRKFTDGRVKANLDIELVVDLFRLADRMDIAVIVSGDGDFAPAIRALQDRGVRCEVISFRPNTSSDLIAVADEFTDAMKLSIGRGRDSKEPASPEMPAKEVVPEFGFREASPAVAAAAKAALRGGGSARSRTASAAGGRTTRSRRTDAKPVAAEAEVTPVAASENGESGTRRRRRRGGRGRGRGRHGETVASEAPAAGGAEWEEFDGLDELEGSPEERPYTFEEADAATLAELGISLPSPQEADGEAEPQPTVAEAKPKRTRAAKTTRTTRTKATTAKADDGEAAPPEKPKRSRSTKSAATAKPKSGARSRKPAAKAETSVDEPAQSDGETESDGIWQRFTSGRVTARSKPKKASESTE